MSSIFDSILSGNMTLNVYLICFGAALVCGFITSLTASYRYTGNRTFYSSLVLLPPIVLTVVTMVNGNVGTGIAVAGSFSLLRFRSAPAKAKDLVSIFISMTAGLCCAAGYVGIALLFTLLICAVSILLTVLISNKDEKKILTVVIPDNLSVNDVFEDIFSKYTSSHILKRTKTTNMGSMYKLRYEVVMKDASLVQDFINELRTRNGNLEISIFDEMEDSEEL